MTGTGAAYYQRIRPLHVRNDSGEIIPPFAVMRITGEATVSGMAVYTVSKPNTAFQRRYLVNGPAAIKVGAIGQCNDGHFVDLDITYSSGVANYGPTPNAWKVVADRYGFELLKTPTASGKYRAVHKPINAILFRVNATISSGGNGTAKVYLDATTVGPWDDITVYNAGDSLATGVTYSGIWANGKWWSVHRGGAGRPRIVFANGRISANSSGSAYVAKETGSGSGPTSLAEDTSQSITVYNPFSGDIMDGTRIMVQETDYYKHDNTWGTVWCVCPMAVIYRGKASGTINAGSSGTVKVWGDAGDTSQTIVGYHDWIDGGTAISGDVELFTAWNQFEEEHHIIGAECE